MQLAAWWPLCSPWVSVPWHSELCQARRTRASEDPAQILAPGIILGVWETEGAVGWGEVWASGPPERLRIL